MGDIRRQAVRSYLASALLVLVLLVGPGLAAKAQDFNPADLTAEDQRLMQQMLESERSHVPRSLPASESVFTIIRTETQPRICRFFVLQELSGTQHQGVGCRVGTGLWQLAASIQDMGQAPAPSASTAPTVDPVPRTVTVIRPAPIQPAPGQPAATASADMPPGWSDIPLPTRRPTIVVGAAPDDVTLGDISAPAVVPSAFAAIPLPNARPSPPAGFATEQREESEAGDRTGDENEPPTLPLATLEPDDTVVATEEVGDIDLPDDTENGEGDTDISAERGDAILADPELAELDTDQPISADPGGLDRAPTLIELTPIETTPAQTAPIETPLPSRRP